MKQQITQTKKQNRQIRVKKTQAHVAPQVVHFFQSPPVSGKLLRAYFLALIVYQIGAVVSGKSFRLWAGNFAGHRASGKLIYKGANVWELSAQGCNYFTDPAQAADKDQQSAFLDAVKTGKAPSIFKGDMYPVKLA